MYMPFSGEDNSLVNILDYQLGNELVPSGFVYIFPSYSLQYRIGKVGEVDINNEDERIMHEILLDQLFCLQLHC